ncbi:hypothetical protein TRFO_23601 [Tritrichomonas foetus]|uniref:Uncharacterized protein n=1 Tax=Tritrichomonas foetus TaxID=1144522 RepID=A0A1J4KEB9_9EUKA|nr:hypothetical protein TRFO_23601 [Tritrichomonas foetus]|eukprot:OHT08060.1 hypothetical protein TRFO_23601 [Tritrichomonas foetus]
MEANFNVQIVGDRTPGPSPADHVDRDRFGDGLKYSIRARYPIPEAHLDPTLVNLPTCIGTGHKHSLSSRHPEPNQFVPPGPNYVRPPFGKDARRTGFPRARPNPKIPKMPGPADYVPSPRSVHGTATESPRTHVREGGPRVLWDTVFSPGPACYKPQHMKVRQSSPRYSIAKKYPERKKDRTGEYVKQRSTLAGPSFSFSHGGRTPIFHI